MVAVPEVTAQAAQVQNTGVSVVPNGTAWANSAWFEFIASTSAPLTIVGLALAPGVANVDFEVDIGTGTIGNEVAILTLGGRGLANAGSAWFRLETRIPVSNIAASTRVALRMRKSGTSIAAWFFFPHYYESISGIGVTANPTLLAPAAAAGVAVATDTGAWTNSAWVEIHSGLTDIALLAVACNFLTLGDTDFEIDVGKGSAGNEVVVGTIPVANRGDGAQRQVLPFGIPIVVAGTNRIAIRLRRGDAAASVSPTFRILYVSTSGFTAVGAPQGTTAVPAVSSNAATMPTVAGNAVALQNSNYVELIASTSTAIVVTGVCVNGIAVQNSYYIDIATGAAGSEVVIGTIGDVTLSAGQVGADNTIYFGIPIDNIPTATRVAARFRKGGTSTTAWGFGITYVPKPLS